MRVFKRSRDEESSDFELPVSMIDVVFLLLIFFMCASKFKTLEQRLDAQLPKDQGPTEGTPPPPPEHPDLRIKISINGSGRPAIVAGQYPCLDLNDLARKLKVLAGTTPDQPIVIDSRQNVPFYVVLGAMDACSRARLTDIKFQAPPAIGGGGSDYWYE